MTTKTRIVDVLGENALVLPALLEDALVANERAKYVLALLQMAASHAAAPHRPPATLRAEREACGIDDPHLDETIALSEVDGHAYHVPGARRLLEILAGALRTMAAPLARTEAEDGAATHARLAERLNALLRGLPTAAGDLLSGDAIAAMTSGRPAAGDGIHVLVMDLHRALNRVQMRIADEEVEGARCFGVIAADRPLIAAFMAGLARTAPLKFDHPGLGTCAARSGEVLTIQNDIGTTEAHVLVVRVTDLAATITYTDVHAQRLRFFQRALEGSGIVWDDLTSRQAAGLGEADLFYLSVGRFAAADEAALAAFLERLGSRIVFLIDWNRARKRLGLLVSNAAAVDLLTWAADNDIGHRGFLELGGERLIYDALEQAVRTPLRYGEPLHEMIGAEAARDYLRFVLRTTATGLRAGRSETLIRDQVRAELFNHFRSAEQRLLANGGRHAAVVVQLANGLRSAMRQRAAGDAATLGDNARHAKALESRADEIVKATRATVQRIAGTEIFCRILETADDAADHLEDAAFLAGLLPEGAAAELPAPFLALADLVVEGAQAFRRAIELAPYVHRGGAPEPIHNFLEAADGLVLVEHQTDQKEREVLAALIGSTVDCRQLHLVSGIARHFEEAADSLLRASFLLRDHILGDVMFA